MGLYDLYRVISGVVTTTHLVVRTPSLQVLAESDRIYQKEYDKAYSEGYMTKKQLNDMLISEGLLPEDYESQIKKIRNMISSAKVEYYNNFFKPSELDKIKVKIESLEFSIISIYNTIAKYSQVTCGAIAETSKSLFLLESSTFKHNGESYDWKDISILQLQNYVDKIYLLEEDIRKLVMLPEWRQMWFIRTEVPIFKCRAYELTTEQKDLIHWSKFYDSVMECESVPHEDIILDQIAIDGWAIKRREDREKEEKVSMYDKHKDAGEIFSIARTPEDIQRINSLNTEHSKTIKEQRFRTLQQKGEATDSDFLDVKLNRGRG